MKKQRIVVLSGAGISAESGIQTFRDADGLWEGYDVMSVASPEGWRKDVSLVLDFYNQRRRQLLAVEPNIAHRALADLEQKYHVTIITQNIDDLHERAGSSKVIHLHGELRKSRSTKFENSVYPCDIDINVGDFCAKGAQLRPHIVWFGEAVPLMEAAAEHVAEADFVIVVGSSMQVYPAAGLVAFAMPSAKIYFIDPRPSLNYELEKSHNLSIFSEKASIGIPKVVKKLLA